MTHCSVLMAVYNGQEYLKVAIDSVLNQSLSDFEFIIIDDCSTDNSLNVINAYDDSRIKCIQNTENLGLAASLNKGAKSAIGTYIARMDADDIMIKSRLSTQIEYMTKNSKVGVCGSYAIQINEDSDETGLVKPPSGLHLKFAKWIPSPLIHPTIVIQRELLLDNLYDESLKSAQDYDLWLRLMIQGVEIHNLTTPLLKYRVHDKSITKSKLDNQSLNAYNSFIKHTDLTSISYTSFLSFCLQNYKQGLWMRLYDGLKIAKHLNLSFMGLLINQFRYFIFKYILKKPNQVNQ